MVDPFSDQRRSTLGTRSPSLSLIRLRSSIGSFPMTGTLKDRYDQIMEEFHTLDKTGNKAFTFEEIHEFLSSKQNEPFDASLCQELYARIDKDWDSLITASDFVGSFVDAEYIVMKRIRELKKQIKENKKIIEDYQGKLIQAREKEQKNEYGIMKDSTLIVNVVDAQDLLAMDSSGLSDPYVILECENQTFQSKHIEATVNPKWNEEFKFNIEHGTGNLKLIVMDRDTEDNDDYLGEVAIKLSQLKDQMKHDQLYSLKNKDPKGKEQGELHLKLQWVWSRIEQYEDLINQKNENIEFDGEELKSLEEQLEKIFKPFSNLEHPNKWMLKDEVKTPRNSVKSILSAKIDVVTKEIELPSFASQKSFTHYLIYSLLLLSTLIMISRPDFVNLMIFIFASFKIATRSETSRMYKQLSKLVIASLVYDFIWFAIYPPSSILDFSVYLSFLLFLMKIPAFILFWKKTH